MVFLQAVVSIRIQIAVAYSFVIWTHHYNLLIDNFELVSIMISSVYLIIRMLDEILIFPPGLNIKDRDNAAIQLQESDRNIKKVHEFR